MPCTSQRHFAESMTRTAAAAHTFRERFYHTVTADWARLVDGPLPDVSQLMTTLGRISAAVADQTMTANHDLDRAKIELARRTEAWQQATAELRGELLALKRVLEGLLGPSAGRRLINCPPALPTTAQELATAARVAAAGLRDPQRELPGHAPLLIDRALWANLLEEKANALDEAGRRVYRQRQQVGAERDQRVDGLADLERQGRAAWLMLKGLMLFNNDLPLLKAMEGVRRPRRKRVSAQPVVALPEPVPVALAEGIPELPASTGLPELPAFAENVAAAPPLAVVDPRGIEEASGLPPDAGLGLVQTRAADTVGHLGPPTSIRTEAAQTEQGIKTDHASGLTDFQGTG